MQNFKRKVGSLDPKILKKLGQVLEREFEPVTKLPLTPAMVDALARLDLAVAKLVT